MAFKSWRSYWEFKHSTTNEFRYFPNIKTKEFLDSILDTSYSRVRILSEGLILWRSQLGSESTPVYDDDKNLIADEQRPHPVVRMNPRKNMASEGRANPKGIPYLYLATDKETAMGEVRPWIGSEISVAQFRVSRNLKIIDCSALESNMPLYFSTTQGLYEPNEEERERAVWLHINNAFSTPITNEENYAHYAPTQIISELFKSAGNDGVIYKSMLGDGYNVVLFDLESASLINCSLYKTKNITFEFCEISNPYFTKN